MTRLRIRLSISVLDLPTNPIIFDWNQTLSFERLIVMLNSCLILICYHFVELAIPETFEYVDEM